MSPQAPNRSARPAAEGDPAADLADVWGVLDSLPTATPARDMAATTVDLMAVKLGGQATPATAGRSARPWWLGPAATVAAALLAGVVLGRATAPDPVVDNLPFIRHVDLLQEAGGRKFLEQLAELMANERPIQPRWFRLARDPDAVRGEAREFDAEIESLRQDFAADTTAARRARLAALEPDQIDSLEKSAETFFRLSPIDRREIESVARALIDPAADRLRDAARLWHVIIAATPPPMRRAIIEMRIDDRLEWLERPAGGEGRFDARGGSRGRDDDRGGDRRPGPLRNELGEPGPAGERERISPDRPPPGRPAGPPPGFERPGQFPGGGRRPPRPIDAGPPPSRSVPDVSGPDLPRSAPPATPGETPAPPR